MIVQSVVCLSYKHETLCLIHIIHVKKIPDKLVHIYNSNAEEEESGQSLKLTG